MIFDEMGFGSYDKAERKARKAFELYEDGKMSQALDELETALEINPANSSWHFDKALTLDAISRFDDAISEFEAALELSPDDLEILNSLAVDYTRTEATSRTVYLHITGATRAAADLGDKTATGIKKRLAEKKQKEAEEAERKQREAQPEAEETKRGEKPAEAD